MTRCQLEKQCGASQQQQQITLYIIYVMQAYRGDPPIFRYPPTRMLIIMCVVRSLRSIFCRNKRLNNILYKI